MLICLNATVRSRPEQPRRVTLFVRQRELMGERIADLARVFQRNIIASRIPEVVTTSDAWLGNKTLLEVLEADGVDPIYSYPARLFAYQG